MARPFLQTCAWTLAIGLAGGAAAAQTATWSSTAMPWFSLPTGDTMGRLPQTVAIPATAWAYGARSDQVDPFGRGQPAILRLDLDVQAGSVGVLLIGVDGSTVLNREVQLKPENGPTSVYIRVRPATPPGFIVLRNYDAADKAGTVTIRQVSFIREGDLSNEELAMIVKHGLY